MSTLEISRSEAGTSSSIGFCWEIFRIINFTFRFHGNIFEYGQKDAVKVINMKNVEMMENYFGFPISLPSVLLSYTPNGASCQEPLAYDNISKIMFSNNMAIKADWTLMEVDHRYDMDLLKKMEIDSTALLLPCVCTDTTTNENTTNVRFAKNILELESTILHFFRPDCTRCKCLHQNVSVVEKFIREGKFAVRHTRLLL